MKILVYKNDSLLFESEPITLPRGFSEKKYNERRIMIDQQLHIVKNKTLKVLGSLTGVSLYIQQTSSINARQKAASASK